MFRTRNRVAADHAYLNMALMLAQRSTCLDKQVGCIITDRQNRIIATGYNGAPRGVAHCIDLGVCAVERAGGNKNVCPSAHAEQNALLQCKDPDAIHSIYLTLSPCVSCIRLINNTACKRIVFLSEHKHPFAKHQWKGEWIQYGAE